MEKIRYNKLITIGGIRMKKVILYTQETCPPCHAEKLWLKENGVEFEERDIRKDDQYMQEIINLGASATPATLIKDENGEEVILGFDQEKLAAALGL
jgi:glutaredoxin